MRPRHLDEIVGQDHLLGPGSPLRRLAEDSATMSVFLWGPPGVGKTTIASVVSGTGSRRFVELSAVTAGVKEVRQVLAEAQRQLAHGVGTVLFVDEVHRFSKTQQDVLLPAVENRLVTLIAATTENPSFSVISPLLSRSLLLTLKPLTDADITKLLERALIDERGFGGRITLAADAQAALLRFAGGDARRALTYLEEAAAGAHAVGVTEITTEIVAAAVDKAAVRYDRAGDQHYDVISAFIKSLRGSDVQAGLHYLARMLEAGEDPRFIARRLIILASEDIGMAAPSVLQTCVAAAQAVALIGMPEARINLAQAVIACALAPKSNAVIKAVDAAIADVRAGRIGAVPPQLRDAHYSGADALGHGTGYLYAHDADHGVAAQQYLPDELAAARYYQPSEHGNEAAMAERLTRLEELLGRPPQSS
ncbi:MAG: replication-associated recombination protein A [Actinobacteria bacterium]|nr:replication-associated recombination protein A [Actinomycetota bacterium]MBU3985894.1 replication-associated recombination protein A [Actinomycetota bacterium]MBU4008679.1 replication-associated recombination protein A [Actinomycetota bacterium]MBU4066171.1 replication-associated recombination protein A [Actinomycetota bacterium]MBU4093619.1 replication-associated recombination protein A [Actinomycetota bacterium]